MGLCLPDRSSDSRFVLFSRLPTQGAVTFLRDSSPITAAGPFLILTGFPIKLVHLVCFAIHDLLPEIDRIVNIRLPRQKPQSLEFHCYTAKARGKSVENYTMIISGILDMINKKIGKSIVGTKSLTRIQQSSCWPPESIFKNLLLHLPYH